MVSRVGRRHRRLFLKHFIRAGIWFDLTRSANKRLTSKDNVKNKERKGDGEGPTTSHNLRNAYPQHNATA